MNSIKLTAGVSRILASLLTSILLSGVSPVWAQLATPTPEQLAKYDTNKNGVLDPAEIRAIETGTSSNAAAPSEEIIELSPFQVSTERDTGYLANDAMSGTRMASKIEDLGASISVITKQQLIDVAALDINDVFQTEIGTEGTSDFTDQTVDFQGRVIDNVQESPYTANRVRGLAAANITIDGFTTNSRIPFDTYNIDSIELSRGPNSSLSGLGDAGGTVNVNQARANLTRETSQIVFRGDDWGGKRTSLDLNRPLLKNKLALRVSGLYDSKGFRREPSEDTQKRVFVALAYKPFLSTTLTGSVESFRQYRRTPNANTPTDMVTDWLNNGRPTWDPITSTAKINGISVGNFPNQGSENSLLPTGLGRDAFFDNMPSMFIEPDGRIVYYTQNRLQASGAPNTGNFTNSIRLMTTASDVFRYRNAASGEAYPLASLVGVSNKDIYDYENINAVATNWNRDSANLYKLQLEQKLYNSPLQQSYAQVAWRLEDSERFNHNLLNETTNIYIDVNERLLDGSQNPFFLRPYVNAIQRTASNNSNINSTGRAQISYALDLRTLDRQWFAMLGRHQALAFYEKSVRDSETYNYRSVVTSDASWINSANRYNSNHATITERYYLGDAVQGGSNQIVDYAPPLGGIASGTYDYRYASNVSGSNITWTNTSLEVDGRAFGGATGSREEVTTTGAVLQSSLWNDRFVTTFGYRKDDQKNRRTSNVVIDPATGFGNTSNLDDFGAWTERSGKTTTYQAVLRPFKESKLLVDRRREGGASGLFYGLLEGVQLHYSHADSFRPTAPAVNLYGESLDNPHGVGRDYGFSINTPDNKFRLRVSWYKTTQLAAPLVGAFSLPVIIARDLELNPSFGLEAFARGVISGRPQYAGASEAEIQAAIYDFVGLPQGFYDPLRTGTVTDVNDQLSKGTEIELHFNPSRNLRFRFTASQTKAIDLTQVDSLKRFIDERVPVWSTIANDSGQTWWSVSPLAGNLYRSQIVPNLLRMTSNLGQPRTQNKEWTWRALTTYQFTSGKLNGLTVGSTIRWADKSTIGFDGIRGADGIIRELDYSKPVYDPARTSYDFMAAYNLRFFKNKIRARIQLNCRDAFANRGLRATTWSPEGYPATFRIIDGRQWVLSTTFDL